MTMKIEPAKTDASVWRRPFRRGPWETLATVLICLGVRHVVPTVLARVVQLLVRNDPGRRRDVRRRHEIPGLGAGLMAQIRVQSLHKSFGDFVAVKDFELHRRGRRVLLPARSVRLRQDNHPAHDRGPGAADLGAHFAGGRGRDAQARLGPRHRLRIPALRALSAHECAAEYRLSVGLDGGEARRGQDAGRGSRSHSADHRIARSPGVRSVGGRPPARGSRARHRAPAARVHDGRTAGRARLGIPSGDVRRAARTTRPAQGHYRLCHARSDRGDVAWRQDSRDEPWRDRTTGRAARDL